MTQRVAEIRRLHDQGATPAEICCRLLCGWPAVNAALKGHHRSAGESLASPKPKKPDRPRSVNQRDDGASATREGSAGGPGSAMNAARDADAGSARGEKTRGGGGGMKAPEPRVRSLRADNGKPKSWTAEQDAALRRLWPAPMKSDSVLVEVNRLGPERSLQAITVRASELKIARALGEHSRRASWTDKQDEILRREYAAGTDADAIARAVTKVGPVRTAAAVKIRAILLKVRRPVGRTAAQKPGKGRVSSWTAEQDAVMRRLWATHIAVERILLRVNAAGLERDRDQLYTRATRLKLRRPVQLHWKSRRKAPAEDPLTTALRAGCRTEVRDGVTVTVCPPAYAFGAWRSDKVTVGSTAGSRRVPA